MTRICHVTTVHPRIDARIRAKELRSLAQAFPDVHIDLYVQDGLGDETDSSGAQIVDTGVRDRSRVRRMLFGSWRMYRALRAAQADIVHFHDPELIPVGLLLKLSGVKVIYDVHEDLPRQILKKTHIPPLLRRPLAGIAAGVEWIAGQAFDGIILAGASLSRRFPRNKSILLYNYPLLAEFSGARRRPDVNAPRLFVYVGGLSVTRGVSEMIKAIGLLPNSDVALCLGGAFQPVLLQNEMEKLAGWKKTDFRNWLSRSDISDVLLNSAAGLVTLHPTDSYLRSYPTKLYEYMAARLPVIASDFPFWREILEGVDCAIFVDPQDPQAIADAMQWILDHPAEAKEMGIRGQRAVLERFNWGIEEEKLISLYRDLLVRSDHNSKD